MTTAVNTFRNFLESYSKLIIPPENAFVITPDDNNDLAFVTRGIYIGGAGDVEVVLLNDTASVIFKALNVGSLLSVRAKRVKAAGTTATNLLAVY